MMQVIGDFVEAFEQARVQGPADLAPFLPRLEHPLYSEVLRAGPRRPGVWLGASPAATARRVLPRVSGRS